MSFGQFQRSEDGAPMSDINMTPLIDVMLVLLVIFIVTAPLLTGRVGLQLPKVDAAPSQSQHKSLTVSLQQNGTLYIGTQPVSLKELKARLALAARNPDTELRLRADRAVQYGTMAEVLAAAQNAGLTHIGLMTAPAKTATPQ